MRRATLIAVAVLVGTSLGWAQANNFELSKGRVGPIHVGMSIDELYQKVGRDNTKLIDRYVEGFFSPAIEIYLGQKSTKAALIAEIVARPPAENVHPFFISAFVVGRISVNDPQFKTDVGIGVGSTLGEIRRQYKVDWIAFGEGPLFARVEQLDMSFALDYSTPSEEWFTTHDPRLIPNSAQVASILVTDVEAIRSQPQPAK